ncbi:MAG: hypothetical protein ABSA96_21390 [Candidatus Acidiferrales bacterium]
MKSAKEQFAQLNEDGWAIVRIVVVIAVIVLVICLARVVNRPEPVPPPDRATAESQALKLEQRKSELAREEARICKHLRNKPILEMTISDMRQLDACKASVH